METTLLLTAATGWLVRTLSGCPGAHGITVIGQAWLAVACRQTGTIAIYNTRTWQRILVSVGADPENIAAIVTA